jgi:branched-chain amino acid transport system substrate-binding protein
MRKHRRDRVGVTLAAALVTAAVLSALTANVQASPAASAKAGPIKIGMIDTMSGPVAGVGTDGLKGALVAAAQINKSGGILGRRIQFVTKDEQLSPTATVKAMRDLHSAGVNLVFGFTSSADALAAQPLAKQLGMVMVASHASATALRTSKYVSNFAAAANSDYQSRHAAPTFLKKYFPQVNTWNIYGYDYLTGHEGWNNFKAAMQAIEPSFQVNKETFIPLTATDLTPYITSGLNGLPASAAQNQGAYVFLFGAGEVNLFKQGAPYNLGDRYKVILTQGGGYEALADTLREHTPSSWVGYDYSYKAFNTPMNKQFVKDFEFANDGRPPDAWAEQSYSAVYLLKAAIEKAHSTATAKVIATFPGLSYTGTQGTIVLNKKTHQAFVPMTFTHFQADPTSDTGWRETQALVIWPPKSDAIPPTG